MRTFILTFLAVIVFGSNLLAQTKQTVALQTGETKPVTGSKLKVKFIRVTEDSRCPEGATCIWAGNAKVSLRVWKKNRKAVDLELNSTLEPRFVEYAGYRISMVNLSPKIPEGKDRDDLSNKDAAGTVILKIEKL